MTIGVRSGNEKLTLSIRRCNINSIGFGVKLKQESLTKNCIEAALIAIVYSVERKIHVNVTIDSNAIALNHIKLGPCKCVRCCSPVPSFKFICHILSCTSIASSEMLWYLSFKNESKYYISGCDWCLGVWLPS